MLLSHIKDQFDVVLGLAPFLVDSANDNSGSEQNGVALEISNVANLSVLIPVNIPLVTEGETVTIEARVEHSDESDSGFETYETLDSEVYTGTSEVTEFTDVLRYDVASFGAKKYVRVVVEVTLSATETDSCYAGVVVVKSGKDKV